MKNKKIITILSIIIFIIPIISINAEPQNNTIEKYYLPSHFSWQDINGTDYTTPVKNQAPAPTCEAYALCASLETIIQYQLEEIFNPDLSETHLYFYAGGTYEAKMVNLTDAANYLIEYGVPDEGCYPDPHRAYDYPFESLEGWGNRTVKIQSWGWVNHNIDSIKSALIEHGPLIIVIKIWKDFLRYHGGVYKHRWGKSEGGHVVTIVGYNDEEECWIVKNSWGPDWGENGYFRMAYDADMFYEYYGKGTGIMYLDGVYGNFKPDVPKIHIKKPENFKTYLFGRGFSTNFKLKKLHFQLAAPRIIGNLKVEVPAENTNKIEFYLDNELKHVDDNEPYEWDLDASVGLHTLKVLAYNKHNISMDLIDVFILL